MPRGPFGFPRLTSLGPFVEPGKIKPNHGTPPGMYGIIDIEKVQHLTARDTLLFLAEGSTHLRDEIRGMQRFEYKKISLGILLQNSEFSGTLMEYVEKDPEEVAESVLKKEINEQDAEDMCIQLQFRDDSRARKECADKIKMDIERVHKINRDIRDSRVYFPPTIYPVGSSFGDTIDGAHRIVALASVIGTDEDIWVWELQNPEETHETIERMTR